MIVCRWVEIIVREGRRKIIFEKVNESVVRKIMEIERSSHKWTGTVQDQFIVWTDQNWSRTTRFPISAFAALLQCSRYA